MNLIYPGVETLPSIACSHCVAGNQPKSILQLSAVKLIPSGRFENVTVSRKHQNSRIAKKLTKKYGFVIEQREILNAIPVVMQVSSKFATLLKEIAQSPIAKVPKKN